MTSETLPGAGQRGWSFPARFGFRFAFLFLIAISLPIAFRFLPGFDEPLSKFSTAVSDLYMPWLVSTLFGVTRPPRVVSADIAYNYAGIATHALLALAGAVVWSALDRRRLAYPRMLEGLQVYVRFVLAEAMIVYGASKVIPGGQFGTPPLDKLVQPLGDSSPMGLLWTFMGYSSGYQIFTGAAELLGGILLTIRRTALLGALMVVGVMINVVALNLCYDVPVKIYSMQLLLLAVALTIPHLRRLLSFFVLNRPLPPDASEPLVRDRRWRMVIVGVRTLLVAACVGYWLHDSVKQSEEHRAMVSPIRGVWNIETLTVGGVERPPLATDVTRWRRFVFDYSYFGSFYTMADQRQRFNTTYDEAKKTIELTSRSNRTRRTTLAYERPDANTLIVTGKLDDQQIRAVCRRGPEEFFLLDRGFHWVSERPLNR